MHRLTEDELTKRIEKAKKLTEKWLDSDFDDRVDALEELLASSSGLAAYVIHGLLLNRKNEQRLNSLLYELLSRE